MEKIGRRWVVLLVAFAALVVPAVAQNLQEELTSAKLLWKQGNCRAAMKHLQNVIARINDLPEGVRPEVNKLFAEWDKTIREQENTNEKILSAIPSVRDESGKPYPLAKMQAIRDSLIKLFAITDSLSCYDLKITTKARIEILLDSANAFVDDYVDKIISENADLKKAVDSLTQLARRYKRLLPVLDSLKALVARQAGNIDALQSQIDSILMMATQTVEIVGGEEVQTLSRPVELVAKSLLDGVENRIIAIGEGKVARKNYTDEERDSLLAQLSAIAEWLDTSLVAKSSPERAGALRMLCHQYMDMLFAQEQSGKAVRWIALAILILIAVVALGLGFARGRRR